MKKFLSLILALTMLACMSVTAFASGDPAGTTKINVDVPDNRPSYVFHCPSSVSITYGVEGYQDIGEISVTDVKNISYLYVGIRHTNLINTENDSDSITMYLGYKYHVLHGAVVYDDYGDYGPYQGFVDNPTYLDFDPDEEDSCAAKIGAFVSHDEWEKATPFATYQATVTYVIDFLR